MLIPLIPDKSTAREKHSSIVCVPKEFCFWIRQKYHTLSNPALFSLASSVEHVGGLSTFYVFFHSSFFRWWSQQKHQHFCWELPGGSTFHLSQKHPKKVQKENLSETEDRQRSCDSVDFCLPEPLLLPQCPWTWTDLLGRTGAVEKNRSWKSRRIELHFEVAINYIYI